MRESRKSTEITDMRPWLQGTSKFAALLPLLLLTACSHDPADDLAVAKMSVEEAQATNYLPLNDDMPGTSVDARHYLVPGKFTIIEYYSPYDQSCINLAPQLIQLARVNNRVAIRTININRPEVQEVDWQSPVAIDAEIKALPYFVMYDPRKILRAKGRPAYEQVNQLVREIAGTVH
ncbi:MAG: hypothetical protein JST01_01130 [Cyanobacteria bacterium SZAS TMP-1]|nr:hypothetical protein [Cyanobacteria bacterium SZAS TMP-1]